MLQFGTYIILYSIYNLGEGNMFFWLNVIGNPNTYWLVNEVFYILVKNVACGY